MKIIKIYFTMLILFVSYKIIFPLQDVYDYTAKKIDEFRTV